MPTKETAMNYSKTRAYFESIYEKQLYFLKARVSRDYQYTKKTYDFLGENHYRAQQLIKEIDLSICSYISFAISNILVETNRFYLEGIYHSKKRNFDEIYPDYSFVTPSSNTDIMYVFETSEEGLDKNSYLFNHTEKLLDYYNKKKIICIKFIEPSEIQQTLSKTQLESICIDEFLSTYFSDDEYKAFTDSKNQFITDVKNTIGYKTIKTLDFENGHQLKKHIRNEIQSKIGDLKYSIVDSDYLIENNKNSLIHQVNNQKCFNSINDLLPLFQKNQGIDILLGNGAFSESFVTAEWLFNSLRDKKGFDYTAIICGYLKSIEQLLYSIVCYCRDHFDSQYWILTKFKESTLQNDKHKMIRDEDYIVKQIKHGKYTKTYVYIKLSKTNDSMIAHSLNTYIDFLGRQLYPELFNSNIDTDMIQELIHLLNCYRTECRNGYFHTDNLTISDKAKKVRDNTIYLHFLILSFLKIDDYMKDYLEIQKTDGFSELRELFIKCKVENNKFILVYPDTSEVVAFSFLLNQKEYTDRLYEHYDTYYFEKYPEMKVSKDKPNAILLSSIPGIQALSKDDKNVISVTKENFPTKIIWIDKNEDQHELNISI